MTSKSGEETRTAIEKSNSGRKRMRSISATIPAARIEKESGAVRARQRKEAPQKKVWVYAEILNYAYDYTRICSRHDKAGVPLFLEHAALIVAGALHRRLKKGTIAPEQVEVTVEQRLGLVYAALYADDDVEDCP